MEGLFAAFTNLAGSNYGNILGERELHLETCPNFEDWSILFVEKLSLKRFDRAVTFKRNMSNSQRLAFAIIEHLSAQLKSGAVVGDSAESLEGKLDGSLLSFQFW